jgi:plastocyanin
MVKSDSEIYGGFNSPSAIVHTHLIHYFAIHRSPFAMTLASRLHGAWALLIWPLLARSPLPAQSLTVTGRVTLVAQATGRGPANNGNAVIWLTPLKEATRPPEVQNQQAAGRFRLLQKNKRFTPHILVVPVGAVVEFPNNDPFFHNVFSMFDGKRFDLGLYEAGSTRTVTFNKPGVSYIFCNIHPEMSAVVIATGTPYYGVSNAAGGVTISGVPAGRYELHVWAERCLPQVLKALGREVTVSTQSPSLGELRLPESGDLLRKHKNKYGRDYDPTDPSSPYGVQ